MFLNCTTAEDILKSIKDKNVQMIDLRFTDLPGTWQHFSVPPSAVDADAMSEGIGFDGSSIRGFQEIQESDMLVVPDATTAFLDPFTSGTTLVLICNIRDPVTGQAYGRDARYVAQKAEAHLKRIGVADTVYFGPEAEFFVFNEVRYDQGINYAYHEIDSKEGIWNSGKQEAPNLGHKPRQKEGYFPVPPVDSMQDLRTEMVLTMKSLGIAIEAHHHEVATAGQAEIDMRFTTLTRMADNLMLYKYVIKNTARKHGMTATFMPKPLFEDNASGMHVHQSLWNGNTNLFYSDRHYANLSDLARYYIGGLLKHAWALCALCAPTTNSYRRLVPGYEAPINLVYSQRNRLLLPDSDVFAEPARQACRVSHAGSLMQRILGICGDVDGRPGRHRETHRSGRADRQKPLRPTANGSQGGEIHTWLVAGGARRARSRSRVSAPW